MTTHYDVMGVAADAPAAEIKRAYYRKARTYHPDAHAGSIDPIMREAERAMSALNSAWNVLRDDRLRAEYDRALAEAEALASAASRKRPHRPGRQKRPPLLIGDGFSYWLGNLGASIPGPDGKPRFNLVVDGASDLLPLRRLAPNGLWGLHASGADLGDEQLVHLNGMYGLELLDLSRTRVSDAGMVHLQGLTRLQHLALWETAIGDGGLAMIGRLPELRHLALGRTRVTDHGLAHLSALADLRVLQLWGTEIEGSGLAHLHGLRNLEIVTLPRRVGYLHRRRLRRALHGALVE